MNTPSDSLLLLCGTLLAIAVAALLWAEWKPSRPGIWLAKPAASTLFVVAAVMAGALTSAYGRLILLGLVLSWLGDVFLISKRRHFFVAGLGSFLLAHLAYGAAFLLQPVAILPLAIAAMAMVAFVIIVLRWLWPHLPENLRPAVVCYVLVISWMVALASGTVTAVGLQLLIGAVMFAASDLFVARERFIAASATNRLLGLPLYYAAQLIFALSTQAG